MRCIYFAFLVFTFAMVQAQADLSDDYWDTNDDYGNYYDYDPIKDDDTFQLGEKADLDTDKIVEDEIKKFKDLDEDNVLDEVANKKLISDIEDYQVEDNREKPKEQENEDEGNNKVNDAASQDSSEKLKLLLGDDSVAPLPDDSEKESIDAGEANESKTLDEQTKNDDDSDLKEPTVDEEKVIDEPASEIIDETKQLLEEVPDQMQIDDIVMPEVSKTDDKPPIEEVIAETQQILKETDETFDDNDDSPNDEISIKVTDENENNNEEIAHEEDTVDKAYADLNKDLDKLFSTLDKLTQDDTDSDKSANEKSMEHFLEDENEFDNNNMEGSEEVPFEDKDLSHILHDILAEDDLDSAELESLLNDEINEPNPDDTNDKDSEVINLNKQPNTHPIAYLDDAIIDNDLKEVIEDNQENDKANASVEKTENKPVSLDDLSSAELDTLRDEFAKKHADEINVKSPKFDKDVAAIHVTLSVDEPTIITSPNYPNPYTTNNIIDWILEGNGVGIEMNITDFALNSAVGDYLLVKPGGLDETGHEGLLFSYELRTVHRYRFFDVDRMFIRFQAMLGMMWMRGFSISLKMIAPRSNQIMEPLPEPEEIISFPNATARVTLALSIPDFKLVKEDFRLILSDMVNMYLDEKSFILDDADESTHIVSVSTCPINWPDMERCTAVTFAVTLPDEKVDVDLMDMWMKYKDTEPFVTSLGKIGVRDMPPPDMSIMTVWLVIGAGVMISMAMLAFVLWRFTCFEDYTRMKSYSDTDSVAEEKRGLDLYPTPHQTLPPLFANEYQFPDLDSTRVDMGGFANKSYARDTMYDFESDEEVVAPRDRNSGVSPRDCQNIP